MSKSHLEPHVLASYSDEIMNVVHSDQAQFLADLRAFDEQFQIDRIIQALKNTLKTRACGVNQSTYIIDLIEDLGGQWLNGGGI